MKTQALKGGDTGPDARRRESLCPACSTPVRSGMLRLYERGEFYHAYCRSRQLARAALHENDGGKAPPAGVAGVRGGDDTPSSEGRAPRVCPICQQAAIVLDGFAGMGSSNPSHPACHATVIFRTSPPQLHQWLRWIDCWIAYANSVVAE